MKWISKLGIGNFMFLLLYFSVAYFAINGHNPLDIMYFISLTIYFFRMFLYYRKKHKVTS